MLREILLLSGKNAGVTVGKRSFCGSSLCFGVCVTGSVLALAGASVLVAMAATGQLDGPTGAEDNSAQAQVGDDAHEGDGMDELAERRGGRGGVNPNKWIMKVENQHASLNELEAG